MFNSYRNNGLGFMASLDFSLYNNCGGHVIDDKSTHSYHALMFKHL
jgi:hypothetical protein